MKKSHHAVRLMVVYPIAVAAGTYWNLSWPLGLTFNFLLRPIFLAFIAHWTWDRTRLMGKFAGMGILVVTASITSQILYGLHDGWNYVKDPENVIAFGFEICIQLGLGVLALISINWAERKRGQQRAGD